MSTHKSNNSTEYYRELFGFGFHPTATHAVMLLRISKYLSRDNDNTSNEYTLCALTTEDVLSFCVDTTQVLVVDITSRDDADDDSRATARTCLVVDDTPDCEVGVSVAAQWSNKTSLPVHFVFGTLRCRRAVDWVKQSLLTSCNDNTCFSLDMRCTDNVQYNDDICALNKVIVRSTRREVLLELALPLTITNVARIGDEFLHNCGRLRYLDISSLSSASEIGGCFLSDCSTLASLDLSSFTNVSEIGVYFLSDCSSLTSLNLPPLTNVHKIGGGFLSDCSSLKSLDLSSCANVSEIGDDFLYDCSSLTSLDLPPLDSATRIGESFVANCSVLTSLDL
eukprot:PhM_4_TR13950/c2_g2_i7/m.32198